jgi:hypothetical protein
MSKVFCLPVRANAPAAASHLPRETGFAPQMSPRTKCAALPRFQNIPCKKENRMAATACLIALALSGLILIVLWEIFS